VEAETVVVDIPTETETDINYIQTLQFYCGVFYLIAPYCLLAAP
jgi:hypothetical protein